MTFWLSSDWAGAEQGRRILKQRRQCAWGLTGQRYEVLGKRRKARVAEAHRAGGEAEMRLEG